ncbi:hypothetical protein D5b_00294 [Faustovirus]|nr:hypothetical protein D5b_00294 [Faustovirus]
MQLFEYIVWTFLGVMMLCVMTISYPYMLNAPAYIVFAWAGALGGSVILILGSVHNWLFNRRYDRRPINSR